MKQLKSIHFIFFFFAFAGFAILISACKKDDDENPDLDNQIYNEVKSADGWVYFKNGDILPGTSPSPHGSFKLRFDETAQSVLDSTLRLPLGSTFPTGSTLVKETYNGNTLTYLVVMKKNPGGTDAGAGWQWAEYNPDGSVFYSVGKQGEACISCHQTNPNRDLVKTFDLH